MARTEPNEIAILIGGESVRFWSEIEIDLFLDSYATFALTAPFEASRAEFRKQFRPFSYQDYEVTRGGKPLFTGTLVGIEPEVEPTKKSVVASGYSKPAVLADCTLPAGIAREFRKMNLEDIALAVTQPFGIDVEFRGNPGSPFSVTGLLLAAAPRPGAEVVVRGDPGAPFLKQKINVTQKVHDFLESLAQQRNFVMSSTADGKLLFWKSISAGAPRVRLKAGERPLVSVKPRFNVQNYFSEVTGYSTSRKKRRASHTERNPLLPTSRFRPTSKIFDDVEIGDIPEATKAELGRMFGEAASWEVVAPTWTDPAGELWAPNTMITITAPDAMIYSETDLVIRHVGLRKNKDGEHAIMDVVLPGAFSGEIPSRLPWD